MKEPTEHNAVRLLDLWSSGWRQRGRQTGAVGPGDYDRYATLGMYGYGGFFGVSKVTRETTAACAAINHFMKTRFPDGAWTSIAVLLNPRVGLHRDIHNSAIHRNCAIGLGDYSGGRVWLEDASDDCPAQLTTKDKGVQELRGTWLDVHDTPICFNARHRFHMVEPHDGKMWALAAYTPLVYRRASASHIKMLKLCGFPTPPQESMDPMHTKRALHIRKQASSDADPAAHFQPVDAHFCKT